MKKLRQVFAGIVLASAVLIFAACAGGVQEEAMDGPNPTSAIAEATPAPEPSPLEREEPEETDEEQEQAEPNQAWYIPEIEPHGQFTHVMSGLGFAVAEGWDVESEEEGWIFINGFDGAIAINLFGALDNPGSENPLEDLLDIFNMMLVDVFQAGSIRIVEHLGVHGHAIATAFYIHTHVAEQTVRFHSGMGFIVSDGAEFALVFALFLDTEADRLYTHRLIDFVASIRFVGDGAGVEP